jgi:NADH dehydrogenase
MRVLIVGASGVLGRASVGCLSSGGHALRALTRDPARIGDLAGDGVEVMRGDLIDPASLRRACAGVDVVVAAAHALLGRGRHRSEAVDDAGHRALVDAASAAGVGRFVYVSALGAAPDHPVDFFRTKWAVERHLAASGLAHAILRPSAFMEWHVHRLNGANVLMRRRIDLLGAGSKPRNFVDAADVAQFVARAVDGRLDGRTLAIGAPGNFSNLQVGRMYAEAAGLGDLPVRRLPARAARLLAHVARPLHPGAARLLHLASLPDDAYDERFDATPLQREFGLPLITVEQFVAAQVAQWRAATLH